MSRSVWTVLGVPANSDRAAIRRGYAAKLKQTNPEDDPEGFKTLRAAYDQALAMADARAHAAERGEDYDDWYEEDDNEAPREAVFTATLTPAQLTETLTTPTPAILPPQEPDLLEGRDRDVADFEARMNTLATQLTSPWANDVMLEAAFRDILASPAMAEIGIRAHAEQWIAGLLADNIPKSDGLLLLAIDTFGWDGASWQRGQSPAVGAVLQRIDEWRTIEALTSKGDQYHFAFNELTRPPRKPWAMRLRAMNPGVAKRVRTLIEYSQWQMPGLSHSFNAQTVAWWEDYLARPRMTVERLALAPALIIVLFALGALFEPPPPWNLVLILGGVAAALALPWVHLATIGRLTHARTAGLGPTLPRWVEQGWIAPLAALPIAVMLVPPSPGWAVAALLIAALGMQWTQIAAGSARGDGTENFLSWILTIGIYGFLGFVPFLERSPETILALCAAAALVIHARVAAIDRLIAIGEPLTQRFKVPGVLAIAALGGGALASPLPPPFIAGAAFAVTALLANAMFHGQIGWLRYATRIAIALAFAGASLVSMPDRPEDFSGSAGQPGIDFGTQVQGIGTLDAALAEVKRNQPGFALIEANNPQLYGILVTIIDLRRMGTITEAEARRRIAVALDEAYDRMLPTAPDALLASSLTIELQRRIHYQGSDPDICAGRREPDDEALPKHLGKVSLVNVLMVVGMPPATPPFAGTPITTESVIDQAAKFARTDRATLAKQLESPRDAERCTARIALLSAILTRPEADIAATVRKTHAERQTATVPVQQ